MDASEKFPSSQQLTEAALKVVDPEIYAAEIRGPLFQRYQELEFGLEQRTNLPIGPLDLRPDDAKRVKEKVLPRLGKQFAIRCAQMGHEIDQGAMTPETFRDVSCDAIFELNTLGILEIALERQPTRPINLEALYHAHEEIFADKFQGVFAGTTPKEREVILWKAWKDSANLLYGNE